MVNPHLLNRRNRIFYIFLLFILLWPPISAASSDYISDSDLDDAEPVEFTSHIMSIEYGKGILVVAENEVMIVNLSIGGEQFTTQVTNSEDEAISIESLNVGQTVRVQGLKLNDGRVVGAKVQQQ